MPLRLIVALVSTALVVPTIVGGWSSVDYVQTEQRIRMEISRVIGAAQRYLQAGSGGEVMDVSLRGGTFTRLEYIIFGDASDQAYSKAVRYRLTGGAEQTMIARNPSVRLRSQDGVGLVLGEGTFAIEIACLDGLSVTVSVVR